MKNIIPESREAERGVLCSILIDYKKLASIISMISDEDFNDLKHKEIFSAMAELHEKGVPVDMITLAQKLSDKNLLKTIGGRTYLIELTEEVYTSSHAEKYAEILKEKSLARKIIKGGSEIFQTGLSGNIHEAESKLLETLHRLNENKLKEGRSINEILEEILVSQSEGKIRGIDTGIKSLDQITSGLKAGHFWIIGGAYKSGKSLLSLEIARRVSVLHKVLFYSLEMNDDEVVSTLIRLEKRNKTQNESVDSVSALNDNLKIFSNKIRLSQIEAHVLSQEEKPAVVFIDHIGLVETSDKEIYNRLNRVSRSLKLLAKRAGVCVVCLSQISEESIKRKSGSFKGSGDIAADCDVGMVLMKDEESTLKEVGFIIDVRFNRHGRRRKIDLFFDTKRGLILFDE